jgi:hypothetical protein
LRQGKYLSCFLPRLAFRSSCSNRTSRKDIRKCFIIKEGEGRTKQVPCTSIIDTTPPVRFGSLSSGGVEGDPTGRSGSDWFTWSSPFASPWRCGYLPSPLAAHLIDRNVQRSNQRITRQLQDKDTTYNRKSFGADVDLPPDMKSPTSMLSSVPAKISAWMFMLPPSGSSEAVRAGKWLSCVCRPGASLHEQQSQQKRVEIVSRVSSEIKGRRKRKRIG